MSCRLVHALGDCARMHPHRPALSWRGGLWTYGELMTAIDAVKAALTASGLPAGSRVALLMRNSPQYVALYYGVMAGGWVAVPLNAHERAPVLARQIAHSGARLLMGDPSHPEWRALCAACADGVGVLTVEAAVGAVSDFAAQLAGLAAGGLADRDIGSGHTPAPKDLAALIYTSGTTGHPKGVMLSHRNLHANTAAIIDYLGLQPQDKGLCVLPFHFSYGNSVLNTHLIAGAHLVIEDNLAYPHLVLERLQSERVTGFAGVPSTFALLLGRCKLSDFELGSLRYVTQAGGAMPRPMIDRLQAQLPNVDVFVMYGQTEATARLTYLPPARLRDKAGSVGVPISGVEIDVRADGLSLGPGESGEIYVRGPNVMLGYWENPSATAETLCDGWLKTGDLGHRDEEGFLYIDGRLVEMIKVGAFRVSPLEVEEVIAALPEVEEVAVAAVADEMLGQAIRAVVVLKPGAALEDRRVKAHCRAQLASYKIPKVVDFAAALPRTSSGKVQRHKLR